MSRDLCFKAQDANRSFRLSWATSAIRFRLGMSPVSGCSNGLSGLCAPGSPLHPVSRPLSKVDVSERFDKPCICIWLLILHLDAMVNRLLQLVPAGAWNG